MDNRLGERVPTQLSIRLLSMRPQVISSGLMKNVSRSGALITGCDLQLYSLIQVVLRSESISAYVTRVDEDGAGIEWCEFAPPAVAELVGNALAVSAPVLISQAS